MLNVRRAGGNDIPSMIEIGTRAATAAHWSAQQYESVFASDSCLSLLVEERGAVLGFLVAHHSGAEWEIENIVISESSRRRGLGTLLVRELLDQVGADVVFLEVRESNIEARSLYKKISFAEVGRRKNYYRDPSEDAIQYRWQKA